MFKTFLSIYLTPFIMCYNVLYASISLKNEITIWSKNMNKKYIEETVRSYLSNELNCSPHDLDKGGTVFIENNRKKFPFLKICTMGQTVIISASGTLIPKIQKLLENKSRDEIFENPFIYGQSIYYIPDFKIFKKLAMDNNFQYELLEGKEIQKLNGISGFENSLAFDKDGNTSTCIVFYAMKDDEIIALAGASKENENMWELGIDVKPEYRRNGLGAVLISNLADTILEKGIIPFYCASTTNISSQAVAHRSGFMPCFVSTYGNIFDGSSAYDKVLKGLY